MKATATILLFPSVSHVLRAESLLKAKGVRCTLIPVPRTVGSDCGVCIRVAPKDADMAAAALREGGVTVFGRHEI
ncbi:MAG: DUF3343 domain-containing protein [Candidatus Oleimicrobiaceae bacterium]